jgi:hypothetical protein
MYMVTLALFSIFDNAKSRYPRAAAGKNGTETASL